MSDTEGPAEFVSIPEDVPVDAVLAEFERRDPAAEIRIRFTMTSLVGSHDAPPRLHSYALKLGMAATYRMTGNWLRRAHHFTAAGTVSQQRDLNTYRMWMMSRG